MNRFDDLLPEERNPEYEELVTILKHAYRTPISLSSVEEEQVIERVRERLLQVGLEDSPQEENVPESQTGVLDSNPRMTVVPVREPQQSRRRFRLIALLAAVLIIVALLLSPMLLVKHSSTGGSGSFPTLTLSSNPAKIGQKVLFTLKYVTPSTRIALTHDSQPFLINGSAFIMADSKGNASFSFHVVKDWGAGSHSIVAEDMASHHTLSADLQIIGQGSAPLPPHLRIVSGAVPIQMGSDIVGANTIRTLNLVNIGEGSITWSASSDQPWLLVSPSQGTFSQRETISVAVQRAGLRPGDYSGNITISTNVSPPQHIEVDMTVLPLPAHATSILALPSALLSFTATDGQSNTNLQMLSLSNPGSIPLHWSLATNTLSTPMTQFSTSQTQTFTCNWLSATPNEGTVTPGSTRLLKVHVNSRCLLPGSYLGTLKIKAIGAIDSTQSVNVSLTVQPNCGLITSTGYVTFTVVQGQETISSQSLSLYTTPGCLGTRIQWYSSSTATWLMSSPTSGVLRGAASNPVPIKVNAKKLQPGRTYPGNIFFITGHSTLNVTVELTVQAVPPLVTPIMSASPLSLNFNTIQGQPEPADQVISISNNGPGVLYWHANIQASASGWLSTSSSGGTIEWANSGQVTVHVNTAQLVSGNYVGQITLYGTGANGKLAPGSPQIIVVNLVVQQPCTISPPSSSSLSFNVLQGASVNPVAQTVMFNAWGGCAWPLSWKTSIAPAVSWLALTQPNDSLGGAGQSESIVVTPTITGLAAGIYSTTVTITASNTNGIAAQISTQTFTVTLAVQSPCLLSTPSPATLAFTLSQGQASSKALAVGLSEVGTCALPVSWQASSSSPWLALTPNSGSDSGTGISFGINASALNVAPGTYTGTLSITATDSAGSAVGIPQSVTVTMTVTGYTISGTVVACADQTCASPSALVGATVTIMRGNATIANTTSDASGNYSFSNLPLGSYTISVIGYDASNTPYTGNISLTLTGNALSTIIQTLPG